MKQILNQALTILSFTLFTLQLVSCVATGSIQALPIGSFSSKNPLRDSSMRGNYLSKKDGTIIPYTGEIKWITGLKNVTTVNGQKIKNSEIVGYQQDGKFYIMDNVYHEVITMGKITIYAMVQNYNGAKGNIIDIYRYGYKTKKGTLQPLDIYGLKDLVKDCPEAYEKVNISSSKISQKIKENPRYLNELVEYYNNGCK